MVTMAAALAVVLITAKMVNNDVNSDAIQLVVIFQKYDTPYDYDFIQLDWWA